MARACADAGLRGGAARLGRAADRVAGELLLRSFPPGVQLSRLAEVVIGATEVVDLGARDPLEQAARTEAVEFLYAQLAELDEDKRAVFILAELEDMSCAEIAVAVGANVNTVTSRLKAARQAFEAGVRRYQARDRRKLGGLR